MDRQCAGPASPEVLGWSGGKAHHRCQPLDVERRKHGQIEFMNGRIRFVGNPKGREGCVQCELQTPTPGDDRNDPAKDRVVQEPEAGWSMIMADF